VSEALAIIGALFEIGGFALVAIEIVRVQKREFPERRLWIERLLDRIHVRRPGTQTIEVEGIQASAAGLSADVELRLPPDATIEQRVEKLEREIEFARRKQREDKVEIENRIVKVGQRLDEEIEEMRRTADAQAAEHRIELSRSLALQKIGTALFVVGAALSALGNVIAS
jgi:hypothetical protein